MIVRCELMTVRWMLVVLFTLSLSNVGAQAASFVVNSATALPSPVQIGQTLKMVGSVSASQNASNYMIGLFVYDVTTSTLTAYQAFTGLNFVVGTPITEEFDWTVPGGTSLTDSYEFAVAIFEFQFSLPERRVYCPAHNSQWFAAAGERYLRFSKRSAGQRSANDWAVQHWHSIGDHWHRAMDMVL